MDKRMQADWEVEIGGGAAVIDALWQGFVDLRQFPERIDEIAETVGFPALGRLLLTLNRAESLIWTAKCDAWKLDSEAGLACYVDMLPVDGLVFAAWQQAESFCRQCVANLANSAPDECHVELIVRQAIAGQAEGFGITAYLTLADGAGDWAEAMDAFAGSIPVAVAPTNEGSKLQ
jgi:hypothetical protein